MARWGPSETLKVQFRFFKLIFFILSSKIYSTNVFFKDGMMLYVFESLKWKAKIWFENPDWKCFKFGCPWGKFWPLRTLWRNLHMVLDILELTKEEKKEKKGNCFKNVVSDLWTNCLCVHKTTFKPWIVHILWCILGTKQFLSVDFWDHIKNSFY